MDRLKNHKETKTGLLEDMLSFIRYTPNREADILVFMEKYQKSENEERPAILETYDTAWTEKNIPILTPGAIIIHRKMCL